MKAVLLLNALMRHGVARQMIERREREVTFTWREEVRLPDEARGGAAVTLPAGLLLSRLFRWALLYAARVG